MIRTEPRRFSAGNKPLPDFRPILKWNFTAQIFPHPCATALKIPVRLSHGGLKAQRQVNPLSRIAEEL